MTYEIIQGFVLCSRTARSGGGLHRSADRQYLIKTESGRLLFAVPNRRASDRMRAISRCKTVSTPTTLGNDVASGASATALGELVDIKFPRARVLHMSFQCLSAVVKG
jgi:hypothetical protein